MFSVVIPLYNKEISITNTIQSVLNQTFQDFEIIVINDGSTDDSVAKVNEFQDPRIRLVNKTNGGVSSARNLGIKEAKFEWIAFLDGDDMWNLDHLFTIRAMMKSFPDFLIFASSFEYSDKRFIPEVDGNAEVFVVEDYINLSTKYVLMWTSIVVVNKRCFLKAGFFNENVSRGEDRDMWNRLALGNKLIKSKKVTATYRIDGENRSDQGVYNVKKSILYHYNLNIIGKNDYDLICKRAVRYSIIELLYKRDFKNAITLISRYNIKLLFK